MSNNSLSNIEIAQLSFDYIYEHGLLANFIEINNLTYEQVDAVREWLIVMYNSYSVPRPVKS